jgi:hypothetical protein
MTDVNFQFSARNSFRPFSQLQAEGGGTVFAAREPRKGGEGGTGQGNGSGTAVITRTRSMPAVAGVAPARVSSTVVDIADPDTPRRIPRRSSAAIRALEECAVPT